MKALPTGNSDAQWDDTLVKNMAYIRKNLCYPWNKTIIIPIIFWTGLTLAIVLLMLFIYLHLDKGQKPSPIFFFCFIQLILYPVIITKYLQTLKFSVIPTDLFLADNCKLIESFLKSEHFLIFRHPELPEVYQIASKDISFGDEQREIMIFIADDKRILLNSHFTNSGFRITPERRHHKQVANMLKSWIIAKKANTNTAISSINKR